MKEKIKIGLTPKGAYNSDTEYTFLDVVTSEYTLYVSKKDHNRGHALSDAEWWDKSIEGPRGKPGFLELVEHGTSDTTFELTPNAMHVWGTVPQLTLTLGAPMTGMVSEYVFEFQCPANAPTAFALPATVKWYNDYIPPIRAGKRYQASILNNVIVTGEVDV